MLKTITTFESETWELNWIKIVDIYKKFNWIQWDELIEIKRILSK